MKQFYLIVFSVILTSCVKNGIAPASAKTTTNATTTFSKTDSVKVATTLATVDTSSADLYNGTKGTALIQVTCDQCTAIAIINNVGVPFAFDGQGLGQLKYTPTAGLSVYVAVCPNGVKPVKVNILDAKQNALFNYTGTTGNWATTYVVK